MNRRTFFKHAGLTAVAGSTLGFGGLERALAGYRTRGTGVPYDLVAVKGGEPGGSGRWDEGWRLLFAHWAGHRLSPAMPNRELWESFRRRAAL